jgi:hypothetical protein
MVSRMQDTSGSSRKPESSAICFSLDAHGHAGLGEGGEKSASPLIFYST